MKTKTSLSRKTFQVFNYTFLILMAVLSVIPIINILAISLSSEVAVNSGKVMLWPVDFTLDSYKFVIREAKFYTAFMVSVVRTLLGVSVQMIITVLAAYPISKSKRQFKARQVYVWFFMAAILFSGGLIPNFLAVSYTNLIDTIWALILPCAVPVFNIILMQNFMKELPEEISEAAYIDGAGHWRNLFMVILPLSKASLATLTLFCAVNHWNSWFDGMLYLNTASKYPLQTYLQTLLIKIDLNLVAVDDLVQNVSQNSSKAAQIFVAMVPILAVYPFLQKYFTQGIVMGSVKG